MALIRIWWPGGEPWERKLKEIKQRQRKERKENNMEKEQRVAESMKADIGTRELLTSSLQALGCPVTTDGNGNITFKFQGQSFVAQASNELLCITVHYPWWLQCSLFDVERFAQIKKAINEANCRTNVSTFYVVSDEGDVVGVHSRKNFVFVPQIPNITDYLKAMLEDFFQTHHFVLQELEQRS